MGKIIRTSPNNMRKAIDTAIENASTIVAKVGYFPSAKYTDGNSIAYVASIQEYGVPSKSIPPRPFFRPTADRRMGAWKQVFAYKVKEFMQGRGFAKDAFDTIGLMAAGEIRQAISEVNDPPLSPITILARKYKKAGGVVTGKTIGMFAAQLKANPGMDLSGVSVKPLIDTGAMQAHLTNVTEPK